MQIRKKTKRVNLPKKVSLWLLLGPAFIWASTAQGGGELIWWPYLVARYGKAFLFLLLPFALMQFFVNKEITKYTAVTGKGIWSGFLSVNKYYTLFLFILFFVNFLWFGGYATAGGSSLYEIFKWPGGGNSRFGSLFWAYIMVILFSLALLFSRSVYRLLEKMMKVITVITVGGLLLSVVILINKASVWRFVDGLFNPMNLGKGVDWLNFDYSKLITALVFAGMGGFLNLMYSYWMQEKGVAMAQKDKTGLMIKDNEVNKSRWLFWNRYLRIDSGLAVLINAVTIILTSFLSFVLLWPKGEYPVGWSITVAQSAFFETSFGWWGRVIFLIVAAAFLVDTWLALADGVANQMADFFYGWLDKWKIFKTRKAWYYGWLSFLIIESMLTMPMVGPGILIQLVGVISMFAFVAYIPLLWYLNYVQLPKKYPIFIKSSKLSEVCLWVVWGIYTLLAGWYVYSLLR
ncbi:hypothetical protein DRH14_00395 [Candidatus Shapirobacteria bacterium]|nr:MAG: hypothetical protein DRH14_00395 [Candidatus Shapirobacteria bacterium]